MKDDEVETLPRKLFEYLKTNQEKCVLEKHVNTFTKFFLTTDYTDYFTVKHIVRRFIKLSKFFAREYLVRILYLPQIKRSS